MKIVGSYPRIRKPIARIFERTSRNTETKASKVVQQKPAEEVSRPLDFETEDILEGRVLVKSNPIKGTHRYVSSLFIESLL